MIKECNFKSRTRHHTSSGCYLTPNEVVCPGEKKCVLFQIYVSQRQDLLSTENSSV